MRHIYLVLLTALALSAFTCPTSAQTSEQFDVALQSQIAVAKARQLSAERDVQLVKDANVAFLVASNFGNAPSTEAANEAIKPLKLRFQDYRLTYRGSKDFCPVQRAMLEARRSALVRWSDAVERERNLLFLEQTYLKINLQRNVGNITGEGLTDAAIENVFLWQLGAMKGNEVPADWSGLDSPGDGPTGQICD